MSTAGGEPFAEILPAGNNAEHIWTFCSRRGVDDLFNALYLLVENERRKHAVKETAGPLNLRERRRAADDFIKQARQHVMVSEAPGKGDDGVPALIALYAGLLFCYMAESAIAAQVSGAPTRRTAFAYTRRLEKRMRRAMEEIPTVEQCSRTLIQLREPT